MDDELEYVGEFEAASDGTVAFLVNRDGSAAQAAVDGRIAPIAEAIISENPDLVQRVSDAAAAKAQSDVGLARGVIPVDRRVIAGTIDVDGRAADDAIGVDGHFFQHTYDEIQRRQGLVRIPSAPIIAGTLDIEGRAADDVIGPDGHFLPHMYAYTAKMLGGLVSTQVAFPEITAAGDSLMETVGTDTPQLVANTLGVPAHNAAKSGMTMEHIALTMGGLHVRFNVAGNAIGSAATAVALTRVAPVRANAFNIGSNDYTWHGYLSGATGQRVHGVLAQRAGTGAWDFTPYTAGPSVPMRPGALFTPYLPGDMRGTVLLLNGGRNNFGQVSWDNVARDLDNTIAALGHDRFVVLTITTRFISAERTGEPQRVLVDEENARRVAKYPRQCFDLNRWMHEDAVTYLGLPADPQDQADLATGLIPRRLYAGDAATDQTHFKGTVYTAWAQVFADFITSKGLMP